MLRRLHLLVLATLLLSACSASQPRPESPIQTTGPTQPTLLPTPASTPLNQSLFDWISGEDVTIPACSTELSQPYFGVSPVSFEDLPGIIPLGGLNPPGHTFPTDHIYFFLRRSDPANPVSAPAETTVFAPGHAWITSVVFVEHLYSDPPYTDYTIHFSPCRQIEAYFMHMSSLSEELLSHIGPQQEASCRQYTAGGRLYNYCEQWGLQIEIQEGEAIGTAGGKEGQNALDMGAMDARVPELAYANPARHYTNPNGFDQFHVVCPIDYFEAGIREQLMGMFGDWGGDVRRTIEPICGEVMQDISGTAQGKWYLRAAIEPFPEDPHIALVHDNVDPSRAVFSVGTSVQGLDSGLYMFHPLDVGITNLDFSLVTPGETVYCYDDFINRFGPPEARNELKLLVQLTEDAILRVEKQSGGDCGPGPHSLSGSYAEFER